MQVSFGKFEQSYGGHTLFKQLDLIIPSGQFFTPLGSSGVLFGSDL
jgi:iron(III) transport system ATP-binding protein